jgi:hypothetical protein
MRWPPRGDKGPVGDELLAAQRVVGLFATEALLALDRYARSIPKPERDVQTANRLAYWWRKLKLDEVQLDLRDGRVAPGGTDAEQILEMAGERAIDPQNTGGVSLDEATLAAQRLAEAEQRAMPVRGMADFREEFAAAYDGRLTLPEDPSDWLGQSLTRLARAAVLRDVVALRAQVRISKPTREAADALVEQGQRLIDERNKLETAKAERPPVKEPWGMRQGALTSGYVAYAAALGGMHLPLVARSALTAPVAYFYARETMRAIGGIRENRQRQAGHEHRLEPAQAELRSVRSNLVGQLGDGGALPVRDTRAIDGQRDRDR